MNWLSSVLRHVTGSIGPVLGQAETDEEAMRRARDEHAMALARADQALSEYVEHAEQTIKNARKN